MITQAEIVHKDKINSLLGSFQHPTLSRNLVQMGALQQVTCNDGMLHVTLKMPFAWQSGFTDLKEALNPSLCNTLGVTEVRWTLLTRVATLKRANSQTPIANIKNIIAISSGKGGVGKSTTAINLALALQKEGGRVGILDGDIYGPSIPSMLGMQDAKILSPDGQHMLPVLAYNIPTQSIGYLIDKKNAAVWRGPMASKALLQILTDTLWTEVDYLVVDMPPGTGDIQLTLAQNMPVTAALIVTTPQDIALIDAEKGLAMFHQVQVPTLGIIENMSYHLCSQCNHRDPIFGEGGAKRLAQQYGALLLGQVPLDTCLRADLDKGTPTVIAKPDHLLAHLYQEIAGKIAAQLYWQGIPINDDIALRQL